MVNKRDKLIKILLVPLLASSNTPNLQNILLNSLYRLKMVDEFEWKDYLPAEGSEVGSGRSPTCTKSSSFHN
jgi:hypothetical protein